MTVFYQKFLLQILLHILEVDSSYQPLLYYPPDKLIINNKQKNINLINNSKWSPYCTVQHLGRTYLHFQSTPSPDARSLKHSIELAPELNLLISILTAKHLRSERHCPKPNCTTKWFHSQDHTVLHQDVFFKSHYTWILLLQIALLSQTQTGLKITPSKVGKMQVILIICRWEKYPVS